MNLPPSSLLGRLEAFLPEMEKANQKTEKLAQEGKLEVLDGSLEVADSDKQTEGAEGTDDEAGDSEVEEEEEGGQVEGAAGVVTARRTVQLVSVGGGVAVREDTFGKQREFMSLFRMSALFPTKKAGFWLEVLERVSGYSLWPPAREKTEMKWRLDTKLLSSRTYSHPRAVERFSLSMASVRGGLVFSRFSPSQVFAGSLACGVFRSPLSFVTKNQQPLSRSICVLHSGLRPRGLRRYPDS